MPDLHDVKKVVLISQHREIISFCRFALEQEFSITLVSEFHDLHSALFSDDSVTIVDCMHAGMQFVQSVEHRCESLRGAVIMLVPVPVSSVHHQCANVTMIPLPCDLALFRHAVCRCCKLPAVSGVPVISTAASSVPKDKIDCSGEIVGFEALIGDSPQLYRIKKTLSKIASKDFSVLLLGESGTGKTKAAELLHKNSCRYKKPYRWINMSTLQEGLADSDLFGSVPGAFTGAVRRSGIFNEANEGVLFMDEIAEVPFNVQAKLLTVLDSGVFYSVGSDKAQQVNVRLIFATNADLPALVRAGKFRSDLYNRIATFSVCFPPLRSRKEDIQTLAAHFAENKLKKISISAIEKLKAYDWPGNIRELKNCIEISCDLCARPELNADDICIYSR